MARRETSTRAGAPRPAIRANRRGIPKRRAPAAEARLESSNFISVSILILIPFLVPLALAIPSIDIRLMAPLSAVILFSSPFMAGLNTIYPRASACECLVVESTVPVAVGEVLGSDAEYLGLDSFLDA
jgi:hypothetical protein